MKPRLVVCSALRKVPPGEAPVLLITPRHHGEFSYKQKINTLQGAPFWNDAEQGFIDQHGVFMDRVEAMAVAKAGGQLRYTDNLPLDWLDSSHLY